jgi:anthranilate phosphoribosyltransferase
VAPLANSLKKLGCEEAMVVHGLDGLDEISTVGKTMIVYLKDGRVTEMETAPKDFGVKRAGITDLQTCTAEESAEILFQILNGNISKDAKAEIVLVNSAAGIMVGGKAENFKEGMEIARESISTGAAYSKLKALVKASGGSLSKLEELESKYE